MKPYVLVALMFVLVMGTVVAIVIPNAGKAQNEVLVRTWVEEKSLEGPATEHPESDSLASKKDTLAELAAAPDKKSEKKHTKTEIQPKINKKKVKVIHHEKLSMKPLKFSRGIQFEPQEEVQIVEQSNTTKKVNWKSKAESYFQSQTKTESNNDSTFLSRN